MKFLSRYIKCMDSVTIYYSGFCIVTFKFYVVVFFDKLTSTVFRFLFSFFFFPSDSSPRRKKKEKRKRKRKRKRKETCPDIQRITQLDLCLPIMKN